MVTLTLLGGDNAEFQKISNVEIDSIFEKIKLGLGVVK